MSDDLKVVSYLKNVLCSVHRYADTNMYKNGDVENLLDEETIEKNIEKNFRYIFDNINAYGGFLEDIFNHEKFNLEDLTELGVWISTYWANTLRKPNDPSKEIKKDISKINDMQEMLYARFYWKEQQQIMSGIYDPTIDKVSEILKELEYLKLDLKNKTFKLFRKEEYYGKQKLNKNDLIKILDDLTNKYNIEKCSLAKKELVDNILK